MRTTRSIFTVIFCIWVNAVAVAQMRTITGTVINGITSEPVPGVMVRVKGTGESTTTGTDGSYKLAVPDTMKTVRFADFAGMDLMEVREIGHDELNIYLAEITASDLSFEDLMKIKVVTASKSEQTMSQAPAIITVITAKQIEERGYQSVGEAIGSVPGLYPIYDYVQYNVGVRGVNGGMRAGSRIIKVMINGQAVSFRPSSEAPLGEELIPMASIERIEIIRGPASALYGANAFLGVVNVITKSSSVPVSGQVSGRFGTGKNLDQKGGQFFVNGRVSKFDYLVTSSYDNTNRSGLNPVDVPGSTKYAARESEGDVAKPSSFYTQAKYSAGRAGDITFDYNYQHLESSGEFMDWGALTHRNNIQQLTYCSRLIYERKLARRLGVFTSVAYSKSMVGSRDKLAVDTVASSFISRKVGCRSLDVVVNADYTIKKSNKLKLGVDLSRDNNDLLTYYLNQQGKPRIAQQGKEFGDTVFANTGLFAQLALSPSELLDIDWLDGLGLTGGARFDIHNIYGDVFNYRLAGVYTLSKSVYTKLLFGTSFKAPSSVQLYSNYITVGDVIGNPRLKPEKAKTLEWMVGVMPVKTININTSFFYNTTKDKVELILPYGTLSNVSYDNVAKITSAGTEVEIIHSYKILKSYVNMSYQRSILAKENLTRDPIRIKTELYPDVMFKFGSNVAIPRVKLNFNIEGSYVSQRIASQLNNFVFDPVNFRTHRYSLPSYYVMNFALSTLDLKLFGGKESRVMVKVNNLLNTTGAWPGFHDFDVPFAGRNATITLTQKF